MENIPICFYLVEFILLYLMTQYGFCIHRDAYILECTYSYVTRIFWSVPTATCQSQQIGWVILTCHIMQLLSIK